MTIEREEAGRRMITTMDGQSVNVIGTLAISVWRIATDEELTVARHTLARVPRGGAR